MAEELLIHTTLNETLVALVDNGVLQETYLERNSKRGLVGNIYLGKVSRVMPGMQSAFIDIGLGKAAFLHVSDMVAPNVQELGDEQPLTYPDIAEKIHAGQSIPVQIIKDPISNKGARLTTFLSLASRFLVYMPSLQRTGVSQRIEEEAERERLRDLLTDQDVTGGYIIRTAAEGATSEAIAENRAYLNRLWLSVQDKLTRAKQGDCVFKDFPLALRALRDLVSPQTEKIRFDSAAEFEEAKAFSEAFMPHIVPILRLHQAKQPLFDLYNLDEEIKKGLQRTVMLKSGGTIVLDQREAMTTIDVNTGGFVGHKNQEETIFKTNMEAAKSIARQLRLRNLGGIIIIDFIDMQREEHKQQLLQALKNALSNDHVKTSISSISALGLVEMTRKRTRESLEQLLCEPCSVCQGRGRVKTVETLCHDIFRDIIRMDKAYDAQGYLVIAATKVVDYVMNEESALLAWLSDQVKKPIRFQSESLYAQETFDVVLT